MQFWPDAEIQFYPILILCQELQFIEFYAGVGNVWRAVSTSGFPSARVDLSYHEEQNMSVKQNPMDILSSAGFAFFGYVFYTTFWCLDACFQWEQHHCGLWSYTWMHDYDPCIWYYICWYNAFYLAFQSLYIWISFENQSNQFGIFHYSYVNSNRIPFIDEAWPVATFS